MAKFRKRPVIVEAWQWLPGKDVPGVQVETPSEAVVLIAGQVLRHYVVTAHGQRAYLSPGDWVLAEPGGRGFYPCQDDIFRATYEPVGG